MSSHINNLLLDGLILYLVFIPVLIICPTISPYLYMCFISLNEIWKELVFLMGYKHTRVHTRVLNICIGERENKEEEYLNV